MTDAPEREWMDTEKIYLIGRCSDPRIGHVMFREPAVPSAVEHTPYIRADLVPSWQPIETAPKSERILLGRKDTPEEEWVAEGMWVAYPDLQGEEDGRWSILNPFISTMPTHWMPLPEPPDA